MINIDDETYTLLKGKGKKNERIYYTEHFTFKTDESTLFPKKENKTFIEFEIDNIDYSNIDEPKKTFETVKGYMGNDFEKHEEAREELGTFLLEVINNYNLFIETISNYRNKLLEIKIDWRNKDKFIRNKYKNDYNKYINERKQLDIKLKNTCVSILQQLLYKIIRINPKLAMLRNYIGQYVYEFFEKYYKKFDSLKDDITQIKKKYPNISYKFNDTMTKKEYIQTDKFRHYTISLKQHDSIFYIYKGFCQFFFKLGNELYHGKNLIDNSFVSNNSCKGKKLSITETFLPVAKIEYKSKKPFKFTYEIQSLQDLFNVTIYQLSLSHQPIINCKNCGKYFIPPIEFDEKTGKSKRIRDDKLYCSEKCKSQYRNKHRDIQKEETTKYYEKLRKRYHNNPIYHKEHEKLKKLYHDCKSKQLDDEETMKLLTNFEETVKNIYTVKRGRPKKQ